MSDKNFEAWGTIDLPRDKEGRFVPPTVRRLYYRDGAPHEVKWLCLSPMEVRISDGPAIVAWRAVLDGIDETVPSNNCASSNQTPGKRSRGTPMWTHSITAP